MVDWDALRDTATKGVYVAGPKKPAREKIQLWFLEILLKSNLTTALPLDQLEHLACAFPLEITISAPAIYFSDTLGICLLYTSSPDGGSGSRCLAAGRRDLANTKGQGI